MTTTITEHPPEFLTRSSPRILNPENYVFVPVDTHDEKKQAPTSEQIDARKSHLNKVFSYIYENLAVGVAPTDVRKHLHAHRDRWAMIEASIKNEGSPTLNTVIDYLSNSRGNYSFSEVTAKEISLIAQRLQELELTRDEQVAISQYISRSMYSHLTFDENAKLPFGLRQPITNIPESHRILADEIIALELWSYYEGLDKMIDSESLLSHLKDELLVLDKHPVQGLRKKNVLLLQGPPAVGKGTLLKRLKIQSTATGTDGYLGGGGADIGERNSIANVPHAEIPRYDEATYIASTFDIPRGKTRMFPSNLMNIAITCMLVKERRRLDDAGLQDLPVVIEGFPRDDRQYRLIEHLRAESMDMVSLENTPQTAAVRQIMRLIEQSAKNKKLRPDDFVGIDATNASKFIKDVGVSFEHMTVDLSAPIAHMIARMLKKGGYNELLPSMKSIYLLVNAGLRAQGEDQLSPQEFDTRIRSNDVQLIQAFCFGALNYGGHKQSLDMTPTSRYESMVKTGKSITAQCKKNGVHIYPINANNIGPNEIAKEIQENVLNR